VSVGVIVGVLAAVFGLIDFLSNRLIRAQPPAWPHAIGNSVLLILATDDELAAVTAVIRRAVEDDKFPDAPRLDPYARRWRGWTRRQMSHMCDIRQTRTRRPRRRPKPTSGRGKSRNVMADELIRPIDEDTAKAIEESAKALGKGFDLVGGLGAYLARALGGVPENLIGILVGDWLIHKRVRRWSELQDETRRILDQRNVKEPDISPSIALPLIEAALDEDREGLKELWAKLLATAMDPKRKHLVRPIWYRR
jgi:Predicted membrane protein (DUF2231)